MLVNRMIEFMLLIALGFILFKTKVLDEKGNQICSNLILKVTMPALILGSVMSVSKFESAQSVFYIFAIAFVLYMLFLPLLGKFVAFLLRIAKNQVDLYAYMIVYSNIGFMGFPVVDALLGQEALFYMAICNMVFNLSNFSIGVMMMSGEGKNAISFKAMVSPGIICSLLALVFYLLKLRFPSAIVSSVQSLGSITTPLSMLLIGSSLATTKFATLFSNWKNLFYVGVRQIVLPILFAPVLKLLFPNPMVYSILFVIFILPIASASVLFATTYKKDVATTSQCVFLSTILAIIMMPILSAYFL